MLTWIDKLNGNRTLIQIVVFLALFVDFILETSIVPIAPNFLFALWNENFTASVTAALLASKNVSSLNQSVIEHAVDNRRRIVLNEENIYVSMLFASKSVVQVLANPFVGTLCDSIGYSVPMFGGLIVTFLSTVLFAFSKSYSLLFVARSIQGLGSSCASTAGLGMLAAAYPDDEERGVATGRALGGLALGILLGPVYGGILYDWQGIELPYLILAGLAVVDGLLQLIVVRPKVQRPAVGERAVNNITQLLRDPYISIVAGSIAISNIGIALIEPTLPIYMMQRWQSSPVVQGLIFLPVSVLYLISTQLFAKLATVIGRWLTTMIGHFFIGLSMIAIPFLPTPAWITVPMAVLGLSLGMCDAANFAEMPRIVDLRHIPNVYGSVYALSDMAICVAFATGPLIGGPLISTLSFKLIVLGTACITMLYAPLLYFNKRIKLSSNEETTPLLSALPENDEEVLHVAD